MDRFKALDTVGLLLTASDPIKVCENSSAIRPAQDHINTLDNVGLLRKADTLFDLARDIQRNILRNEDFTDFDGVHIFWMLPELVSHTDYETKRFLRTWRHLDKVFAKYDLREWSFFYQVSCADLPLNIGRWQASYTPTHNTTIALFPSAMSDSLVMTVLRFVGAHNLETFWPCTKCNPYWMYWHCHHCRLKNSYVAWTSISHFGRCGKKCLCCRSARLNRRKKDLAKLGCRACEDLLQLGRTCRILRKLIKAYDGIWAVLIALEAYGNAVWALSSPVLYGLTCSIKNNVVLKGRFHLRLIALRWLQTLRIMQNASVLSLPELSDIGLRNRV